MYVCDSNHEQIVYDGGMCPMCQMIDDHNDMQYQSETMAGELENTKSELEIAIEELSNVTRP